jgi:hypothetical protein
MVKIHATGNWSRGAVTARMVPSSRLILPHVEALIAPAWKAGKQRLGEKLFDGPMCRMESWRATDESLTIQVSFTSYRIFLGTNLNNAESQKLPREVCANPVGVSSALLTDDGYLMYGRRNALVAYYPHRVHPFAGALEEKDLSDVFGAVERELNEELNISPRQIDSIHCIGIAEDQRIRHPELIFRTRVKLSRRQIEQQVHDEEHGGSVAIEASRQGVGRALADASELTPIAIATLMLFARSTFG